MRCQREGRKEQLERGGRQEEVERGEGEGKGEGKRRIAGRKRQYERIAIDMYRRKTSSDTV